MDRLLYVAMNGASRSLHTQSAISHNIANASTPGFKAALVRANAAPVAGEGLATRVNAAVGETSHDSAQGRLRTTGRSLDVALNQGHWLAVQATDGSTAYTRSGDLNLNELGQLMTASGDLVLSTNGAAIAIPPATNISIGADGAISIIPQGQGSDAPAEIDQIQVVAEPESGMERGLDGLFRPAAQQAVAAATGNVLLSGALEESNVSVATALVDMIAQQRHFETQVKLMNKADENAQRTSELMRLR